MPILHLGVLDVPYGPQPKKSKRGKKVALKSSSAMSTGDVADILEAKYHPIEIFFEINQARIAKSLENGLAGALESMLMGAPPTLDPLGSATSAMEDMFRRFITEKQMDRLGYPGVPTKASLAGVNHRLLHPFARTNQMRPSFVDTGQYLASFKAWVTG